MLKASLIIVVLTNFFPTIYREFDVILSCDSAANKGNEYLINYQNDIPDHYVS